MEIAFHPSARAELDASVDFYEAHLKGLGTRFLAAVEETTERIAGSPEAGSSLAGGFRKRLVPGFPSASSIASGKKRSFLSRSLTSTGDRVTGAGAPVGADNTLEPTDLSDSFSRDRRCAGGSA